MMDLHIRQEPPPPADAQCESPLRLLIETGLLLASERSVDVIVQTALDAGLHLCHATFGAFFYNNIAAEGPEEGPDEGQADAPSNGLYKLAGPDRNVFAALSAQRPAEVFSLSFFGREIIRSADITLDPRYVQNPLFAGTTPEHLPIRSYLAVPVRSRTGNVFGRLLYGDTDAGVFTSACEDLVATIASQAAVAIDNVRLSESLTAEIASRKNQESALRQSEKLAATGRLAATIAHEINNPLEAVTNLIYLSRTDPGVPAPVQALLETADTELARVAQIAQQTLGFYRDTTRPIEIDLNELLHSVVSLFARKMVSRKITCTLDLEPDLCIHGLQGEIRQIFSNLLVNAIDAFNFESVLTGGAIHIRGRHLRGPRNAVSVLICDQGSGISASVRQRIFSPFFTTKQSVGTGLGLWVTRGFAEKHGGSIHFRTRTTAPSGTVFRIILPVNTPVALFQPGDRAPQYVA